MADNPTRPAAPQVQINASDEIARGRYSNNMLVTHTREEFILDFMNLVPPQAAARTTPRSAASRRRRVLRLPRPEARPPVGPARG